MCQKEKASLVKGRWTPQADGGIPGAAAGGDGVWERVVGEGFIPPGTLSIAASGRGDPSAEVPAAAHYPGGIYAAPTTIPGMLVGDAYMRPGQFPAATSSPGGINPSPTRNKKGGRPTHPCVQHPPDPKIIFSFSP